jgi:hypothetical protein
VGISDKRVDDLLLALSHEGFGLPFMASVRDHPDPKELHAADEKAWEDNRESLRNALEKAEIV